MLIFLKRLLGIEQSQLEECRKFQENLAAQAQQNIRLDELQMELDGIIRHIEERQSIIELNPSSMPPTEST